VKARRLELALAAVRDLRPERRPPSVEELADFKTRVDVMACSPLSVTQICARRGRSLCRQWAIEDGPR
jgi:hypothetical protein